MIKINSLKAKLIKLLATIILIGCNKEYNKNEAVINPKACFTVSEQVYTLNDSVSFFNCSEFATEFHWTFDSESISDDENPVYLFNTPGDKKVTLVCTNENGKTDSISQVIKVVNEKYFNIEENDNVRVYPIAMKIVGNGIYVVSGKYNINQTYSVQGVLEKYDLQFNKKWEKSLGSNYGNPPKGDMMITSNNQFIILVRGISNASRQYIYLMDTIGNMINKLELNHYHINGMIEQDDSFIFCGNYLTASSTSCILKTDKNLNKTGNTYYSQLGRYTSFLDITNNGNLVILGQMRDSDDKIGSGDYFLYFLNSNLDSLSFYEMPVNYNFLFDNCAKLRGYNDHLYFYDFSTIYSYDTNNKVVTSKQTGSGYIRAFDLFRNQFVLFDSEKTFTYDLDFNLVKERDNAAFTYYTDYFIDIEEFSDNEYLLLGSYNEETNTFLEYAEHLRFFIYGKD